MTKLRPLKKNAMDLCDTSLYPQYIFYDVSLINNVICIVQDNTIKTELFEGPSYLITILKDSYTIIKV